MIINLGIGSLPAKSITTYTNAIPSPSVSLSYQPARLVTNASEVLPGDLFCALKGKVDGHAFIGEAIARGASLVLCENAQPQNLPTLTVKSTYAALGDWAEAALHRRRKTVIAITGSVGKTTLKNTLSAFLSSVSPTHATVENQNNALGVPFTVLSAPLDTRYLVAECGSNHPGEIAYLSRILHPNIAVVTCIGHAHVGAFGSREGIAREKLSIADHMAPGGALFLPFGETLTASLSPAAYTRSFVKLPSEAERRKWGIEESDVAALWAFSYTKAIGRYLGLPFDGQAKRLHLAASSRRKLFAEKEILWIEDCYNASPESVYAALIFLSSHRGGRVAILGDMLELGERATAMHRAMGKLAALSADRCFFFGEYAEEYAKGAMEAGATRLERSRRRYSVLKGDALQMARSVLPQLKKGDTVLAKASHALHAEILLHQIKETYIP
ncbi:MAG: UDP-N-acetylmuramoyl-tripeptide--D-alanyl-D-alanine ligase [Clostridia bacterium]|nr:UDP-N-acetylmuramoyl-tripeptide--D-alanyl-D-alanine ligase [Clostridia bacterium]